MSASLRSLLALLLLAVIVPAAWSAAPPGNLDRHGDLLPRGAVARFGSERFRLFPDDQLAYLSRDARQIGLWIFGSHHLNVIDATTGRLVRSTEIPADGDWRKRAVFPSGDRLALRCGSGLAVHDLPTGKRLWFVKRPGPHHSELVVDPTGAYLALCERGEGIVPAVRIYRADTGKRVSFIRLFDRSTIFALSADGSRLLSGDEPGTVTRQLLSGPAASSRSTLQLWNLGTGRILRQIVVRGKLAEAAFRPGGKALALAVGESIQLWDPVRGTQRRSIRASGVIRRVLYSPDGKWLVAVTKRGRVNVWDARTGRRLPAHLGPACNSPTIAFPESGRIVACGSVGQQLVLWDAITGKLLRCLEGHRGGVTSLRFSGTRLLTASEDGDIITWNLSGRQLRRVSLRHRPYQSKQSEAVTQLVFSPGGRWLLGESDAVRVLHDSATRECVLGELGEVHRWGSWVRVSRDDSTLVVRKQLWTNYERKDLIQSIRISTGEELPAITLPMTQHLALAISPIGQTVAVAIGHKDSGLVRLYQTATGKCISGSKPFKRLNRPGSILEFSPDGRHLLGSASEEKELFLLDARAGACLHEIKLGSPVTGPLVFSPCGRMLAMSQRGDVGDDVAIYELSTGQKRLEFSPRNLVTALAFSADGRYLASGHATGTALLWNLDATQPRASRDIEKLWRDLAGRDARVAFQAMLTLQQRPAQAVRLVRTHVRPAPGKPLDAAQVDHLIALLDADDFQKRQRATAALNERIEEVAPALLVALEGKPSLEVRMRLTQLVSSRQPLFPRRMLLPLRAVELLERIGDAKARRLLGELAQGYQGSLLTLEARAAHERLKKRALDSRQGR